MDGKVGSRSLAREQKKVNLSHSIWQKYDSLGKYSGELANAGGKTCYKLQKKTNIIKFEKRIDGQREKK